MAAAPTILVFDSGLGGLTVFREIAAARPDARFVYVADDAGFPYGNMPEEALITRILHVIGKAIAEHAPDLVVVACNTASTLALAELRARFTVPFVGTVPAIKPACAQSKTQAHRRARHAGDRRPRIYPRADPRIRRRLRCGAGRLAAARELTPRPSWPATPVADAAITAEIAGCFVEADGRRTDTVVLACTHYPLLLERFRAVAPWPVEWLDPAPAIARRVADLLRDRAAGRSPAAAAHRVHLGPRALAARWPAR